MADTQPTPDPALLAGAIEKLQSVELTYEELAAVADHVLDGEVMGFTAGGLIDWGGIAKNMNIEIGMASHGSPTYRTPTIDGQVMGKGPIPSTHLDS